MRYFVTGGTGFIGSWVVQRLAEIGAEVTCLVRKSSNLRWIKKLPVQLYYGSLLDPESLKPALGDAHYVLHIAGVTKALRRRDFFKGNVLTTQNLLQAIKEANPGIQKFVHISSQAAVGPSRNSQPINEDSPCHPITEYGRSKLQSEEVVKAFMHELPITILRPTTVYGPRDTDVLKVFKNLKRGINVKVGWYEQYICLIHVFDLVNGILLAAKHPNSSSKTYFVCNDVAYRWSEITSSLKRLMGSKVIEVPVPFWLAYGVASLTEWGARIRGKPTILNRQKMDEVRQPYWVVSNQKIKSELGFTPQLSIEEGLKVTFDWYREHHWL